jgi:hypothetical protein
MKKYFPTGWSRVLVEFDEVPVRNGIHRIEEEKVTMRRIVFF